MSLESALIDLEKQLEAAAKAARAAHAVLKKAQASARVGNLRDLQNQLAEGRNSGKRFAEAMAQADESWTFKPEPYFAEGGYLHELKEEADRQSISLFEKDGRIYCFPMLLTLSEKDSAVIIDRKPERRVRPSALVKLLAARQNRPQRANTQKFLEALFDAYLVLAPQVSRDWSSSSLGLGPVVQLLRIYDLLTLLPGAERDYTREEFARDIHLLDQQPDLRTKDGRRFALPASTGSKAAGKRLTVIDPQGTERIYVGIRFDKE
ncbi:MAG: hypothetical protein WAS73_01560 [Defluviicoccus sp.]